MSWLRASDTVASDPRTLHPLEHPDADERTVDEVFGFSVRLAAECGSKETDGIASLGMARALAGTPARLTLLMSMLVDAGVWEAHGNGWRLIKDSTYLHLRSQAEIERDRVRARDRRDDRLTVYARLRDGDECRYCRELVNWRDKKSLRGAEYDHVNIANQPTILDEFVVSCRGCNGDHSNKADLLPVPTSPKYGNDTREFVRNRLGSFPTKSKITAMLSGLRPDATENATGTAGQRSEASENATETAPSRPANTAENAQSAADVPQVGDTETPRQRPVSDDLRHDPDLGGDGSRSVGTGRDGKGSSGSGRDSPGGASPGTPPPTRMSPRRSRRSKSKPTTEKP